MKTKIIKVRQESLVSNVRTSLVCRLHFCFSLFAVLLPLAFVISAARPSVEQIFKVTWIDICKS